MLFFRSPAPLARIDYVFHSEGLRAVEAHVWPTSGYSDHHPLFVQLAIVGNVEAQSG